MKQFFRSSTNKKLAGVCGGLGDYFNVDPLLVRLGFVMLAWIGGGGLMLYILLWLLAPEK